MGRRDKMKSFDDVLNSMSFDPYDMREMICNWKDMISDQERMVRFRFFDGRVVEIPNMRMAANSSGAVYSNLGGTTEGRPHQENFHQLRSGFASNAPPVSKQEWGAYTDPEFRGTGQSVKLSWSGEMRHDRQDPSATTGWKNEWVLNDRGLSGHPREGGTWYLNSGNVSGTAGTQHWRVDPTRAFGMSGTSYNWSIGVNEAQFGGRRFKAKQFLLSKRTDETGDGGAFYFEHSENNVRFVIPWRELSLNTSQTNPNTVNTVIHSISVGFLDTTVTGQNPPRTQKGLPFSFYQMTDTNNDHYNNLTASNYAIISAYSSTIRSDDSEGTRILPDTANDPIYLEILYSINAT